MKPISENNCDFPSLRGSGCLYVDKTAWFHRLASAGGRKMFFLARPLRFGKSLTISTLEAMFQGRRELFGGLAIMDTDRDWRKKYPVIHLDMGMCATEDYDRFFANLPECVKHGLVGAGCRYNPKLTPEANFDNAIDVLAKRSVPPVILIDGRPAPVAKAQKDAGVAERVRASLAPVYGQMKDRSGKIRFPMITRGGKVTQPSTFSTLSSLADISFEDAYTAMSGYTEGELDRYFSGHMEAYRAELKRLCNGYRFWLGKGGNVYNPVSINHATVNPKDEFKLYRAETGKASFLMNLIARRGVFAVDPEELENVSKATLDVSDLRRSPVAGMPYQPGYLTILDYSKKAKRLTLGIPNAERTDRAARGVDEGKFLKTTWTTQNNVWFFRAQPCAVMKTPRGCAAKEGCCLYKLFRLSPIELTGKVREDFPNLMSGLVADHPCGMYIFELKAGRPPKVARCRRRSARSIPRRIAPPASPSGRRAFPSTSDLVSSRAASPRQ